MAYDDGQYPYGTFYWGPTVDGHTICGYPRQEFSKGHFAKVPVLVDRDGVEGVSFTNLSETKYKDVVKDMSIYFQDAPERFTERLLSLYLASTYNSSWLHNVNAIKALVSQSGAQFNFSVPLAKRVALFGDAIITCPTHYIASALADAGVKTYKLMFNAGNQVHGATESFILTSKINPSGESDFQGVTVPGNATVGRYMRNYWVSFAIYQDPNRLDHEDGRPHWPEFTADRQNVLEIDPQWIRVVDDADANFRCDVLGTAPVKYVHI